MFHDYYPTKYKDDYLRFADGEAEFNSHYFYMPLEGQSANLDRVPSEQRDLFLIYFALEVMWNELLFTYFKEIHFKFQFEHSFPMTYFCGHGKITDSPWSALELLSDEFAVSPNSDKYSTDHKNFAGHVHDFLEVQRQRLIDLGFIWDEWSNILHKMLEDEDATGRKNPYSKVVRGVVSFNIAPTLDRGVFD